MKTVKLVAQPRELKGSSNSGRLRRKGMIPAIVYGAGKETRVIQLNAHDVDMALKGHASEHMLMDLDIGGDQTLKVLLKEIQHHPVSGKIIHADFNEVSMTKKLRVEIPIRLVGEPAGVTQQGGVLEHIQRTVEVECLPTDIIESIQLDVSGLHIGESLLVSSIQLDPAKYVVHGLKDQPVAAVAAPKLEEEPTAAAAAEGAAAEPEVITEKKVEGEEGEEAAAGDKKGEGKKDAKAEGKKDAKPEAKKEGAPAAKEEGKKGK